MAKGTRARSSLQITPKKFERLRWDPDLRERKTTTDYLATALRTAIYDGQFADGEELNQVELAVFFHVSRVPIREALRQLQAEGLVRIIAHHRTVVSGLTLSQILELLEMRAVLESYMLLKAAPNFDKTVLNQLRKICDETDLLRDYGSRWVVKNWEFHRLLYHEQSQAMVEAVERIHLNIERYARHAGTTDRQRQAATEHRQILNAIERKDYEKAAALLERHILNTGDEIRRNRERLSTRPLAKRSDGSRKRPTTKSKAPAASSKTARADY